MIDNANSYVRTRGLILIATNSKWDEYFKIDEIITDYLKHINDEKTITAYQCIKMLSMIVRYKLDFKQYIINALNCASPTIYNSSMKPLVLNDIKKVLKVL